MGKGWSRFRRFIRRHWRAPHAARPVYEENVNLRTVLLVVLGLVLSYLLIRFALDFRDPTREIMKALGGALLTLSGVALIYEVFLRRSVSREAGNAFRLATDLASSGVLRVAVFSEIEWEKFFRDNPGDIEIAVSYGQTWANAQAPGAIRLASSRGGRVVVNVLDPEGPAEMVNFYSYLFAIDPTVLRNRINDTITTWRSAAEAERAKGVDVELVIEGLQRVVPYTFYRSGDAMWVVLNPRRAGRVPAQDLIAFQCARSGKSQGLYNWVIEDIEACRSQGLVRVIERVESK